MKKLTLLATAIAAVGLAHPALAADGGEGRWQVKVLGTGVLPDDRLSAIVQANFDARAGALVRELDLRRPIFRKTAAYGHFGRSDAEFTWERTDKAEALRDAASGGGVSVKPVRAAKKSGKNGSSRAVSADAE